MDKKYLLLQKGHTYYCMELHLFLFLYLMSYYSNATRWNHWILHTLISTYALIFNIKISCIKDIVRIIIYLYCNYYTFIFITLIYIYRRFRKQMIVFKSFIVIIKIFPMLSAKMWNSYYYIMLPKNFYFRNKSALFEIFFSHMRPS